MLSRAGDRPQLPYRLKISPMMKRDPAPGPMAVDRYQMLFGYEAGCARCTTLVRPPPRELADLSRRSRLSGKGKDIMIRLLP